MIEKLKNYILGLLEFDLTSDIKYLEQDLIDNEIIASDDSIEYEWLDKERQKLCINVMNNGKVASYKIEINIIKGE